MFSQEKFLRGFLKKISTLAGDFWTCVSRMPAPPTSAESRSPLRNVSKPGPAIPNDISVFKPHFFA